MGCMFAGKLTIFHEYNRLCLHCIARKHYECRTLYAQNRLHLYRLHRILIKANSSNLFSKQNFE